MQAPQVESAAYPRIRDVLPEQAEVVVVGAGFGGLATALTLAEAGVDVLLVEALAYPGGCAGTFSRKGLRLEAGATLVSGLDRGGLLGGWIHALGLPVEIDWLDPVVELRTERWRFAVPRDRRALRSGLLSLDPRVEPDALERFLTVQRRTADLAWRALDDPRLLPPPSPRSWRRALGLAPAAARLLPLLGRGLEDVARSCGLPSDGPLRTYRDALSQITVQADSERADAVRALAAMDYYHRGTAHVRGGVGQLAWALVHACRARGGRVRLATRVTGLLPRGPGWVVETSAGAVTCGRVVCNLLPRALRALLPPTASATRRLRSLTTRVDASWGACMLYGAVPEDPDRAGPRHVQVVGNADQPLVEGNHVFCSVSGVRDGARAPSGWRSLTASTHVDRGVLEALPGAERARHVRAIQERMRALVAARAPEWAEALDGAETASPRTFERFTGRPGGAVGGAPALRGLPRLSALGESTPLRGLHLVGDSVFPGQSVLAVAAGGRRLGLRLAARLGRTH